MTWPDGSKRRSDAMINGPDPLISAEYGLLYQKGHEHSGRLVNILQRWEGGRVRKKNEKSCFKTGRSGDRDESLTCIFISGSKRSRCRFVLSRFN